MGQPRSPRQLGGEEGDEYAEILTAGGFGRSGYDELAVADWDVGAGSNRTGAVSVHYGSKKRGLTAIGDQLWTVGGSAAPHRASGLTS